MTFGRTCLLVMLAACAHGGADTGGDGGTDATTVHHDAHPQNVTPDSSLPKDAAVAIDASIMIDAALAPDASTSGNICTANAQCTDSGQCCLSINGVGICSNGIIIGSTCLPQ